MRAAQQTAVGLKRSGSHWCEKEEVEKAAQGIVSTGPDRVTSTALFGYFAAAVSVQSWGLGKAFFAQAMWAALAKCQHKQISPSFLKKPVSVLMAAVRCSVDKATVARTVLCILFINAQKKHCTLHKYMKTVTANLPG